MDQRPPDPPARPAPAPLPSLRAPAFPGPSGPAGSSGSGPAGSSGSGPAEDDPDRPDQIGPVPPDDPDAPASWRVKPSAGWLKAGGALLAALAGVAFASFDRGALFMFGLGAVVLAVLAARDLIVPVRVAADTEGLTVARGFGHRRLAWSQIERVVVDERGRLGRSVRLLEIDVGDDLFLYGEAELGAPVGDVAARLEYLRVRYAL